MKGIIRNLILFIVIGGILAGGFYYVFNKNTPEEANITSSGNGEPINTTTSNTTNTSSKESLSGIKLDTSIFSNPAFLSLRDSSVILIPRGNEGRPNPFLPIGIDNTANSLNSFNNPLDDTSSDLLDNTLEEVEKTL